MILFEPQPDFSIGSLPVQVWGLSLGLGFVAAILLAQKEARRSGNKEEAKAGALPDQVFWMWIVSIVVGFIAARLSFVLLFLPVFRSEPVATVRVWEGGLFIAVGVVAAFIAALVYARVRHLPFLHVLDVFVPSLLVLFALEHVGSFFIGQNPGAVSRAPWSVVYLGASRHPLSLYEALFAGMLFIPFWMNRVATFASGVRFAWFLMAYAAGMFVLQFFAANDLSFSAVRFYGLTLFQFGYCALFLAGSVLLTARLFVTYRTHE
jgi:phosphatidylglycerol---prolipoprotein diacylglyceryl transferase